MGWFSDFWSGKRRDPNQGDFGIDPRLKPIIDELSGWDIGIGKAAKWARKDLRRMRAGEDVSNFGYYQPIRDQAAVARSGVDMDYLTGGNALLASAGGEQANLLNRMRDVAKERINQQEAMAISNAMPQLYGALSDTLQRGKEFSDSSNLQRYGLIGDLTGRASFDNRRQGGFGGSIIRGAIGAGMGLLTGGASLGAAAAGAAGTMNPSGGGGYWSNRAGSYDDFRTPPFAPKYVRPRMMTQPAEAYPELKQTSGPFGRSSNFWNRYSFNYR